VLHNTWASRHGVCIVRIRLLLSWFATLSLGFLREWVLGVERREEKALLYYTLSLFWSVLKQHKWFRNFKNFSKGGTWVLHPILLPLPSISLQNPSLFSPPPTSKKKSQKKTQQIFRKVILLLLQKVTTIYLIFISISPFIIFSKINT
jgi:hypothetical protein